MIGGQELAKTTLFQILMGEIEPDEGSFKWGVTTSQAYFPKDNTEEFDNDLPFPRLWSWKDVQR